MEKLNLKKQINKKCRQIFEIISGSQLIKVIEGKDSNARKRKNFKIVLHNFVLNLLEF